MSDTLEFRPVNGALGIARVLAHRFGLGFVWDGKDGVEQVLRENIPERPVQLTPRAVLESSGLVKRPKKKWGRK